MDAHALAARLRTELDVHTVPCGDHMVHVGARADRDDDRHTTEATDAVTAAGAPLKDMIETANGTLLAILAGAEWEG